MNGYILVKTRNFRFIYGTMFILNIFSVIVFAFLPTKQYDSIASKSSTVVPSFANQISEFLILKIIENHFENLQSNFSKHFNQQIC